MHNKLGVIVIGQSPRPDCVELFGSCLHDGDEVVVKGALDDLTDDELAALQKRHDGKILIALDRKLNPISIPEEEISKRMQGKVTELEQEGANIILVYCSGRLQKLESTVPLLLPGEILEHTILAIAEGKKVGVLVPDEEQVQRTIGQFEELNTKPHVLAASPFGPKETIVDACRDIAQFDPALIVMDCTSYNAELKKLAQEITGKPVITAESVLLSIVSELSGK